MEVNINSPARSFKGVLLLFVKESYYNRDSENFVNPNITKVSVVIEGKPNQLFTNGMMGFQQFDEIRKILGGGHLRSDTVVLICKDFHLHDARLQNYLVNRFAFWIDFRTIPTNELDGSGRRIENGTDGITIDLHREANARSESIAPTKEEAVDYT